MHNLHQLIVKRTADQMSGDGVWLRYFPPGSAGLDDGQRQLSLTTAAGLSTAETMVMLVEKILPRITHAERLRKVAETVDKGGKRYLVTRFYWYGRPEKLLG